MNDFYNTTKRTSLFLLGGLCTLFSIMAPKGYAAHTEDTTQTPKAIMYNPSWHESDLMSGKTLEEQSLIRYHRTLHNDAVLKNPDQGGLPAEVWFNIISFLGTKSRGRFAKTCRTARELEIGAPMCNIIELSYTGRHIPASVMGEEELRELLSTIPPKFQEKGFLALHLDRCYLPPCFTAAMQQENKNYHPFYSLSLHGSTLGLPSRRRVPERFGRPAVSEFDALVRGIQTLTHLRSLDLTFGMFEPSHVGDILRAAPQNLATLILDRNRLSRGNPEDIIGELHQVQNLRTLSLKKSRWPWAAVQPLLTALQALPHFETLRLEENGFTQDALDTLKLGHIEVHI